MSTAIARAIHAVLSNSTAVQDVLGTPPRLYDSAPEDPVFPYLSYGTLKSEDIGGDETHLTSHQITLHLWSRYAGRAEILQLLETLKTVLNDQANLASFIFEETLVSASVLYSDVMRASDARTQHGLLRLSLLTEIGVIA